jgi:hypothetical protein
VDGTLYDGATAFPHAVRAEVRDGGLELSMDSGWNDLVNADLLKRIDTGVGSIRLGRADMPGWRLILPGAAAADLAPLLGREERYGRWIDRIGLIPALGAFGAIAVAVVAIGYRAVGSATWATPSSATSATIAAAMPRARRRWRKWSNGWNRARPRVRRRSALPLST